MAKNDGRDIFVTISLGVASFEADQPVDMNTLLDRADKAMYRSKEAGRNRVMVWGKTTH